MHESAQLTLQHARCDPENHFANIRPFRQCSLWHYAETNLATARIIEYCNANEDPPQSCTGQGDAEADPQMGRRPVVAQDLCLLNLAHQRDVDNAIRRSQDISLHMRERHAAPRSFAHAVLKHGPVTTAQGLCVGEMQPCTR